MADLLLSALVPIVMEKAADILVQRISDMWGIADQRERLHDKLLAVQHVLTDAEDRADANPAVKSWLAKLTSAAYDADDVLDEFLYEELHRDAVRHGHKVGTSSGFFSLENSILFRYKMSGKLKEVVGRIDELVTEMETFKFVQGWQGRVVDRDRFVPGPSTQVAGRIKTDSLQVEVVGRDEDKEKIVRLLVEGCESNDLMVVPVVGMGGLGKTALAKLVYNDSRVKEYFDLPLWVCVSEEFNIGQLVKSIIDLVEGGCNLPIDNMELLQRRLFKVLSGKRYILVLDDVWNENVNDWERLRAMLKCGDSGSVVIVTTRNKKVAQIMGTVESYNLSCLGEGDSWSLFHKRAFSKGVKECQDLLEIGRKMVQNCQGLPLAIKTLGSLMSSKYEVREWLAVLKESRFWEQRTAKGEVLPVLRLSFDHLSSSMKQCFAFCAVYPKDYEMDKEKLIQFWIANGFIPFDGSSSLEMIGNDIFNELAWRSFFQEVKQVCPWRREDGFLFRRREDGYCSKTKCKMHDLMHDLAQSIMGDKCQSIMHNLSQYNRSMINNVHHISINNLPIDIKKAADYFPSIRSLISGSNCYPNVKNIEFIKSNSLRTLELRGCPIEKTTFTPHKMKYLRYLELWNDEITSLPEEISTLYLLQTLRIFDCYLKKLPEGMRYMSSLRHLYIEWTDLLESMPKGLGQLNCLQTLTIYVVGTDDGNGIGELNNLNNLSGQLHLYNLREIKHVVDAREANLMAKQNLDDLALCWGMPYSFQKLPESNAPGVMHCDPFEVLDALKPCNKLKVLKIDEYRGDKLPVWMTEYQMLENLIELYIIQCRECRKVPPVEKLPFLRILKLEHLDNLIHLCNSASTSAEGGEDVRVAFPSLKNMTLSELPELCSWYEGEVGNKSSLIFPKLTALKVKNCPKLTAIPIVPLLTSMTVQGNKNLSCFATGLTTLHKISLESQDGNETLSFQPWESLNELFLGNYSSIVPLGSKEGEQSITPTKCRSLEISKVFPSNTSLWFWKCFTFLKILTISNCDSLIYWPEEVFSFLNCLEDINVEDCPNFLGSKLESTVGMSITEVLLPKLRNLSFQHCPNLVEIPKCSLSIQSLLINDSSKLHCLPEWLGNMVALECLRISQCESFNTLPLSMGDLARLEFLLIYDCPNLAYLPEGMEGLKALKELNIKKCPKIRALPEGLLQQLKNLNELQIKGCPHLERHFRNFGKYRHLISEISFTDVGEESTSNLLKDLVLAFPSCKNTCFSARS